MFTLTHRRVSNPVFKVTRIKVRLDAQNRCPNSGNILFEATMTNGKQCTATFTGLALGVAFDWLKKIHLEFERYGIVSVESGFTDLN